MLPLSDYQYGIFTGGTLHEIAHVIAASTAGGAVAEDIAIVVKLTRVALLVPVAIIIGYVSHNETNTTIEQKRFSLKTLPIPWFIIGFLITSSISTWGVLPSKLVGHLIMLAYILLAMAMAGLGLQVDLKEFKREGMNIFYTAFIGTLLLVGLGLLLITIMNLN